MHLMIAKTRRLILTFALILAVLMKAYALQHNGSASEGDSDFRPPVTEADAKIVQRARVILDSPSQWNRSDTRICPAQATTFSLYCALEKATKDVTGDFKHRGATMQETRFVIDDIAPNRKKYHHRLMDYNNDSTTTFADIQRVLRMTEERIARRLAGAPPGGK